MLGLLALAFAAAFFPQAPELQPPDPVVRIDAVVADARRRPLDTLTASDFEVREDGDPQAIEAVRFVRAAESPRLLAIYLDEYHLSADAADRVRDRLLRFVDGDLDARDRVVVMKPLDSVLTIALDSPRADARRAIAQLAGRKGNYAPADAYEREYIGRSPQAIDEARAQIAVSALQALASRLGQASAAARKTLIVVSEGFDAAADHSRISLPTAASISQSANRANVAVYAVDPRADAAGDDAAGALARIANETGGFSIAGAAALDAGLRRVAADSGGYYLISYQSSGKTDDRFHAVQVRVRRPGALVRTRPGYWAVSPDDLIRAEVLAAVHAAPVPRAFEPPQRVSPLIRPWFGLSRGPAGRTRVTFAWEAAPVVPGDRSRSQGPPARLQFTAVSAGAVVYEATVRPAGVPRLAGDAASNRVVFDVPPGRLRVRMSIENAGAQEIDTDVRDLAVSDLGAPVAIGTPEVLRIRTARDFRAIAADPDAAPAASRVFSRSERLVIRVPAYAPDGPAVVSATLMSGSGRPMRALEVTPPPAAGGPSQIDLPLAGLASAGYQIEFRVKSAAGEAKDAIAFRVTP